MRKLNLAGILILAIFVTLLTLYHLYSRSNQVSYNIEVTESTYQPPWWNITLTAHEPTPKITTIELFIGKGNRLIAKVNTNLRTKDKLHISFYLPETLPQKTIPLYIFFDDNTYMIIELEPPETAGIAT